MTRRRFTAAGCALLLTAGVMAAIPAAAKPPREVNEPTATGSGGAVASAEFNASQAGIDVLRRGGNAIDAAVATAAALGVTRPFVAGPGGGGYMVIYLAKSHQVVTIDGRETCPGACTTSMFIDPETGQPLAFEDARRSGLSVGVPGMTATWATAVAKYGNQTLAKDLKPAIDLARTGFTITPEFNEEEQVALADLQTFTSSRQLWLKNGQPLPVGSRLKNPDLASTYSQIAKNGPQYLYRGPLATDIVNAVVHPPVWSGSTFHVRNGFMTTADLRDYQAKVQPPSHVNYRGLDIYGMAPSSSGGITIGEALNILSGFPMSSENRAAALYQYLEASRLAFADRNAYIGDNSYVDVPQHGLLDPAYAATRRCLIQGTALTSPLAPGNPYPPYTPCSTTNTAPNPVHEGPQTNHLTVADKFGNVVSYTNTIEQLAGSGITVPGRGFLLNNEMTDFDFAPATPSTYDPNLPAAGKRPRSSMSPTIVLQNGRPSFAVGSPGGSTIITTVLQILINKIDFGLSLPAAIAAPRVSQRNSSTSQAEAAFYNSALADTLRSQYGENFSLVTGPVLPHDQWIGNATGITILGPNQFQAAAEPVRLHGGSALVVNPAPGS